jgi:hypothetical protein
MYTYNPVLPDNLILYPVTSDTVLSTGWSQREIVAKKLTEAGLEVAAIGNLYSVAGIEILIRNLAHNYQITRLVHMSGTKLDQSVPTTETLRSVWAGSQSVPGLGDSVVRAVTDRVQLVEVASVAELFTLLREPRVIEVADSRSYPNIAYPLPIPEMAQGTDTFSNGHLIRGTDINDAWIQALTLVMDYGHQIRGGHGPIMDVGSLMTHFPMGPDVETPVDLNRATLDTYAAGWLNSEMVGDSYTYGSRLADQLGVAVENLRRSPHTNRVLISLSRPGDMDLKNPPCMISIGFKIRSNRLHCRSLFRSHDIGSGWYPNSYALIQLARHILTQIGDPELTLGDLTVISESAHIYNSASPAVLQRISAHRSKDLKLDPVGDFVIRVSDQGVSIQHYSSGGARMIRNYRNPLEVLAANPTIGVRHYGYLCREFARAELQGLAYQQDR